MKKIILILGPNAVGKSTVARELLSRLTNAAYINSDSCRAINPFPFTEETKKAVTQNIHDMCYNYLCCKDIETIIFPYSFHGERKEMWEQVLQKLQTEEVAFTVFPILLKCSWEENIRRAKMDNRDEERIERGMKNTFYFYDDYSYPMIDTTNLTIEDIAEKILEIAGEKQ